MNLRWVNKPQMRTCRKIIFFQLCLKNRDIQTAAVLVFKYSDIVLNVPNVFLMCLIFLNRPPTDIFCVDALTRRSECLL